MYHNLTDTELVNLPATTALETELQNRLAEVTDEEWEELREKVSECATEIHELNLLVDRFKTALSKVATEIHRCAESGEVHITPDFRRHCDEVVVAMDEYVVYEYPKSANFSEPKNNSSSFRACGEA